MVSYMKHEEMYMAKDAKKRRNIYGERLVKDTKKEEMNMVQDIKYEKINMMLDTVQAR